MQYKVIVEEAARLDIISIINYIINDFQEPAIAEKIYERHCFLKNALMAIGVDNEQAEDEACKIEHDISDQTFSVLKAICQEKSK